MKTRCTLTICFVVGLFFTSASVSLAQTSGSSGGAGGAGSIAQNTEEDMAQVFGQMFAENQMDPLYVLHFVSYWREYIESYDPQDQTPALDFGARVWQSYRLEQGFKRIRIVGSEEAAEEILSEHSDAPSPWGAYSSEFQPKIDRYRTLKGADLRGLSFNDQVEWNYLDLRGVKFDRCLLFGSFWTCNLDETSWNGAGINHLKITRSGQEWSRSSLRNAELDVYVHNDVLIITHTDMEGTDMSQMLLGQQYSDGALEDVGALVLRHCDVTDAIIPIEVYARASVRDCTGVVRADYEEGQRLAAETNVFADEPPPPPTSVPKPTFTNTPVPTENPTEIPLPTATPVLGRGFSFPKDLEVVRGEEIEVAVLIDNAKGVSAYSIGIFFATESPLTYVEGSVTTEGTLTEEWTTLGGSGGASPAGMTIVLSSSGDALAAGSGALIKFRVRAKDESSAESAELLFSAVNTSLNNGDIPVEMYDGRIFILPSSKSTPTPTATPTVTPVPKPELTITEYVGYGDQTFVAGTDNARMGSFVISAGTGEGVEVSSINVALSDAEAATVTNMHLKDSPTGEQLGDTVISLPTSNVFSVNFSLLAGESKVVDLYADVRADPRIESWTANVSASGIGTVSGIGVELAVGIELQTITISPGALLSANGEHPPSAILLAGTANNSVAQFQFTAVNEGFTIDKLMLKTEKEFAEAMVWFIIKYKDKDGNDKGIASTLCWSVTDEYAIAILTDLDIYIPRNSTRYVDVTVDVALMSSVGNTSGNSGKIYLDYDDGFRAISDSGVLVTNLTDQDEDLFGNTFHIRKSKPTFTRIPLTGSPAGSPLFKFRVVADSLGEVEIKQLGFHISASSGVDIYNNLKLYDSATGMALTDVGMYPDLLGDVVLTIGSINDHDVLRVGTAGKILDVRGTIGLEGWGAINDSLSISFKQDKAPTDRATALDIADRNFNVWSDLSVMDAVHTTKTTDWHNGYLLDLPTDAQEFVVKEWPTPTPTVTPTPITLSVSNGNHPESEFGIIIAGTSNSKVAEFVFDATWVHHRIEELQFKINKDFSLWVENVAIEYPDTLGQTRRQNCYLADDSEDDYAVFSSGGIGMFVPREGQAKVDVYIDTITPEDTESAESAVFLKSYGYFQLVTRDSDYIIVNCDDDLHGNTFRVHLDIITTPTVTPTATPTEVPMPKAEVYLNTASTPDGKLKVTVAGKNLSGLANYRVFLNLSKGLRYIPGSVELNENLGAQDYAVNESPSNEDDDFGISCALVFPANGEADLFSFSVEVGKMEGNEMHNIVFDTSFVKEEEPYSRLNDGALPAEFIGVSFLAPTEAIENNSASSASSSTSSQ